MISHANLSSGQTANYYKKDDYYKAQDNGVWIGELSTDKGLCGHIAQEDFNAQILERGTRQGYEIHCGAAKNHLGQPEIKKETILEACEKVKEYIEGAGISMAGRMRTEVEKNGAVLTINNKSTLEDGIRKYEPNDEFLRHKEKVGRTYKDAVNTLSGLDAGKIEIREKSVSRVAFDFTVSAPKSVSMAMAQGGQAEKDMNECHAKAVDASVKYMETHIDAQKKVNGAVKLERTGNMLAGRFTHFTNRNQEPNLHDHIVIFNKTRCADGKERAIDPRSLVENKYHFDMVYKTELARLVQEKGYEIKVDHQQGTFELKGITRSMIEAHSSRRVEIMEKIAGWGKDPHRVNRGIRDAACQLTREAKKSCDLDLLKQSWRESLKEHGVPQVAAKGHSVKPEKSADRVYRETERSISGRAVAFTRKEYLDESLKRGMGQGVTLAEAQKHFREQLKSKGISRMGEMNGKEYFATRESLETEKAVFRHVEEGRGAVRGLAGPSVGKRLEEGTRTPEGRVLHLSAEQKKSVWHIATTNDRFSAVQGLAGTGKTTMLNQAREIFESQGYTVKGVCFTGKAAEGLEKEAGISSKTIHAHLNTLEKESGVAREKAPTLEQRNTDGWKLAGLKPTEKEVWIVDEASMVDNRLMKQVQEAAILKDAKVVFTGDAKQLQPIGAGNAFSNMVERNMIAHTRMEDIQRQKDPALAARTDPGHEKYYLRQAVREAVEGNVQKALDKLQEHIVQVGSRAERIARIAGDYSALTKTERKETVIVTGTNADRREINERVRENLKARGELGGGREFQTAQGKREFSPGDKIVFLKNDRELNVKNGQVGVVRGSENGKLAVLVGHQVKAVDLTRYNHVDHGYTLTAHKSQGITADRALIHIDTEQKGVNNRNAFYVDVSRARHEVKIYTDDKDRIAEKVSQWQAKLSSYDFSEKDHDREMEPNAVVRNERVPDPVSRESNKTGLEDMVRISPAEELRAAGGVDLFYQTKDSELDQSFAKAHDQAVERELTYG